MGSVKGKCNSKERRERIHGNFVQKKRLPNGVPVNSRKVIRRGHMK
jgi:hypothetical protein